ncbi:MAG: hypothetical protein ACRDLQ_04630 [Solirubrobacterales bacterium]
MRPGWKWVAAMSVLVVGIAVSVSGAATSGSKRDGGSGSSSRNGEALRAPSQPPGEHLATLAGELGVSQDRLREALEAVRQDLAPPQRPRRARRPSRAQMERRCTEFTDALAKELDKSGDDVRAAIKSAAKKGVEEAVDDGRLTRSQADRILSRLDDAACVPAFGFHGPGGPGCGGPGGPGGPGGRFERPAAPPGDSGSEGGSMVAPAPPGAPA